ncbi:MAG: HIRAN domain-containing protein [Nitriliruptor sp.]
MRGHAFAARPPGLPAREVGGAVRLVREPDNPRDELAVAVWAAAPAPWRVGYLDRAVAARLAPRLDDGQRFRASLEGWIDAPGSRWRRPLLRIEPVGPAARDGAAVPTERVVPRAPGVRRRTIPPER